MDKQKSFQVIARQFQVSDETAKYFLGRIQKSFKNEKPPQTLIIQFMGTRKFDSLPEPYDVAKMMYEAGIWVFPMNSAPPKPEDEEDIYR